MRNLEIIWMRPHDLAESKTSQDQTPGLSATNLEHAIVRRLCFQALPILTCRYDLRQAIVKKDCSHVSVLNFLMGPENYTVKKFANKNG